MKTSRLVILCARTTRSVAYLQGLAAAGITPDGIVIYGATDSVAQSSRNLSPQSLGEVHCPDLRLTVAQTLERLEWTATSCAADTLDASELLSAIAGLSPDLLVYSGYGGQLVPTTLLESYPVLHIHSGWLPQYRGSTTLYYQIIEQGKCAASALLLDATIDTGPVLARREYPMPPAGLDVDYLYDNAIRADLLVHVLARWRDTPEVLLHRDVESSQQELPPYFIIHPLLKHLALQAVDGQGH